MDKIERIGRFEAITLLIAVVANNILFNIPSLILTNTSTGVWLNLIYITVISIIFIIFVCKLFKSFTNADILDISKYLGGKALEIIIGLLYIVFFIFFSALCIRYFANNLHLIYFNTSPLAFLMLLFLIPVVIVNKLGLKAISNVTAVFFPFTFISIIILLFAASKEFVWQKLFPILGFGAESIFWTNIPNLFAFNIIAYIFFLKPMLKQEKDFKIVSIVSVIICGIYLLAVTVSLLGSFAFFTQTDEMISIYILSRLVSLGKFLQRIDAIFIFLWILVFLSFLSFNFYCSLRIIKKITNATSSNELSYCLALIVLGIALCFKDVIITKLIFRKFFIYYMFILIFIISLIVLLLAYFKKTKKKGLQKQ